jgi:hypothetical protein
MARDMGRQTSCMAMFNKKKIRNKQKKKSKFFSILQHVRFELETKKMQYQSRIIAREESPEEISQTKREVEV